MKNKALDNSEKIFAKVRVNTELNKFSDMVLFPKKVAKAKEAFKRLGLPKVGNSSR